MITMTAKAYNAMQTAKWREDWQKAVQKRGYNSLPQLAFYIFMIDYGYVAFGKIGECGNRACWAKTKKEAIKKFES